MNTIIAKKTIITMLREASDYFKNNSVVMQFIPILLILAYATYRHEFTKLSHSVLGKLFAVMLILYYTRMDIVYGTVCCIIVIWYYQRTEIEGMESVVEKKEEEEKEKDKKEDNTEVADDGTNLPPLKEQLDELAPLEESSNLEGFETFEKPIVITIDQFNVAKDEFIKEKCKNGVLMYKDFPVKSEMADHVYSEIKFNGKNKCNPCDRTCDYNIIEAKLETEKKLIPKTSNELFDAFKQFFGMSEPFEPREPRFPYDPSFLREPTGK
jgi:hypothetical protein